MTYVTVARGDGTYEVVRIISGTPDTYSVMCTCTSDTLANTIRDLFNNA